jgi:hypothetical protein
MTDVSLKKVSLTKDGLNRAMLPPNNCKVKKLLDSLEPESKQVLVDALNYDRRDFSAAQMREWLLGAGIPEEMVPGVDAIVNHRSGRMPCRCKG